MVSLPFMLSTLNCKFQSEILKSNVTLMEVRSHYPPACERSHLTLTEFTFDLDICHITHLLVSISGQEHVVLPEASHEALGAGGQLLEVVALTEGRLFAHHPLCHHGERQPDAA